MLRMGSCLNMCSFRYTVLLTQRKKSYVNNLSVKVIGLTLAVIIAALNAYLVFATLFPKFVPGVS